MINYDIVKMLGEEDPTTIYRKLKNIAVLTGNNGEFFRNLVESQSTINPVLNGSLQSEDGDPATYAAELQYFVEELYPDSFGIDGVSIWDESDIENGEYSMMEFYSLCYMYITTYMVSEKEFLDDFMERIAERNAKMITELERARKSFAAEIKNHLVHEAEKRDSLYEMKTITLESASPDDYEDLLLECKVLDTEDKIEAYLNLIPLSQKIIAVDNSDYSARPGLPGEQVDTSLRTSFDGREYIIERRREEIEDYPKKHIEMAQVIVSNKKGTSNNVVLSSDEFNRTFEFNDNVGEFSLQTEPREFIQVSENLIINGTVVLAGSYMCLDEFNNVDKVVDKDTFEMNYSVMDKPRKTI